MSARSLAGTPDKVSFVPSPPIIGRVLEHFIDFIHLEAFFIQSIFTAFTAL